MWCKRLFIIVCVVFFAMSTQAKKIKWKYLKKIKCEKVEIQFKDNKRKYCRLDASSPIKVKIKGPTHLKIRTRIELQEGFRGEQKYKLEVVEDNKKAKEFSVTTKKSDISSFVGRKGSISETRNIYVNVPSGRHSYSLRLVEPEDGIVYVRFYRKLRKLKYVSFSPKSYHSLETIIVKEKERAYYRATKEKEVSVEVFGPTKLKVITRLEFTPEMKGEQSYGVQVRDCFVVARNDSMHEYTFKTSKSEVAGYVAKKEYVPGDSREFILKVPKGKHRYEFKSVATSSVLFRFFIPEKDIKKGE